MSIRRKMPVTEICEEWRHFVYDSFVCVLPSLLNQLNIPFRDGFGFEKRKSPVDIWQLFSKK